MKRPELEKIIAHRPSKEQLSKDKYEYCVKMKNIPSELWVSQNFLHNSIKEMLYSYQKKNGISDLTDDNTDSPRSNINGYKEENEELNTLDYSKFLALNFNEQFGIKLEVGVDGNDIEEELDVMNIEENQPIQIKSECIESTDELMNGANDELIWEDLEARLDQQILEAGENHNKLPKANSTEPPIAVSSDKNINQTSNENNIQDSDILQIPNENIDDSYIQMFEDVSKKTPTPIVATKIPEKLAPVRNITQASESDQQKIFNEAFAKLTQVSKVAFEKDPIYDTLEKITIEKLKLIVDQGDNDLLQALYLSSQRDSLQILILSKPSIFVLASQKNHIQMVSLFLLLGVNVNANDSKFKTALMYACENENEPLIDLLVNNGAAMNIRSNGKNDIMFQCILQNKPRAIRTLLNLGVNFSQIQCTQPFSLENCARQMKRDEISCIAAKHHAYLSEDIKRTIMCHFGSNIKIIEQIMPIYVFSQFEISEEKISLTFDSKMPLFPLNQLNIFFALTGIILGSGMKCLFSDSIKLTSVILNDFEQESLTGQHYKTMTCFSPLKERNYLTVTTENPKCRKMRMILVAYNVKIID